MTADMLIVDRIEGDIAVCEQEGRLVDIPLSSIKGLVREGDVLSLLAQDLYCVDAAATVERRKRLTERFSALIRKKK